MNVCVWVCVYVCVCVCPEDNDEPVKGEEVEGGVYEYDYYPIFPGKYIISITWGGQPIPRR